MENTFLTATLCFVVCFFVAVCPQSTVIPSRHEFCRTSNVNLEPAGTRAEIKSQDYPNYIPNEGTNSNDCFMYIKACKECNMTISASELVLPPCNKPVPEQGSCIPQCDHLLLFEPDYPERTTHYIFEESSSWRYTTFTRNVFIKFCRTTKQNADTAFRLYIDVGDKTQHYNAFSGEVGSISSPFFPDKYNAYIGLDLYQYDIVGSDTIYVYFTDWNLMPESYIKIWLDGNRGRGRSITRNASERRPFVRSDDINHTLYIDFYTGKEDAHYIAGLPYPGFRLQFQLFRESSPYPGHVCGYYFKNVWGGNFEFKRSTSSCSAGDYVDCVWVFTKQNNQDGFQTVELTFTHAMLGEGDFLEVRSGTVSTGEVIARGSAQGGVDVNHVYSDDNGFYVHLTSQCQWDRVIEATFISVENEQREWDCDLPDRPAFWCDNWGRCIHGSLVCDGIDHCGNGKDEQNCPDEPSTCYRELSCRTGNQWYCEGEQCDGVSQCDDATDESGCSPANNNEDDQNSSMLTVIPAIVVPIVLGLCICAVLVYFVHKRMKRKKTRRAAYINDHSVQRSSFVPTPPPNQPVSPHPPFAIGGFMTHPEAPPSYEASQQHVNMGYMRSNSEEMLGKPPPYQPNASTSPPPRAYSAGPSNENTSYFNQSNSSSSPVRDVPNMDASRSLTGAGALHSLSITGVVLNIAPTVNRQSTIDVQKENERNMNLEAGRQDTETKTLHKTRHKRSTRVKKKLDLTDGQSTSQTNGAVAPRAFDNGAYSMNTTDEENNNLESSV